MYDTKDFIIGLLIVLGLFFAMVNSSNFIAFVLSKAFSSFIFATVIMLNKEN